MDDNAYPIVAVGDHEWLGANLRVTRAPDGALLVTHRPDEDAGAVEQYGLLYDWGAASRACMDGWHLPSDEEWQQLAAAGGTSAGSSLKDTEGWTSPSTGASNGTGFAARGAGYWSNGEFPSRFGEVAVYWSATPVDDHFVWARTLASAHDSIGRAPQHPNYGFSVRCVRNY